MISDKQRAWIEEYLTCWNATEAAKRAGYTGTYGSLRISGHDNLHNPEIQVIITERIKEKAMTADEVLARLGNIARGSMSDFISINGHTRLDLKKAQDAGQLHLIKSFTKVKGGTKIELHDQLKALELLGKAMGLFVDRQEISGANGGALEIRIIDDGD
jgi:phage terminase small subunit